MPAIHDPTFLRRIALFRDLDLGDLAVLNGLMRRQDLPAGVRLMASDTPGDSAYVIRHGAVKVHVEQEDGRDVIVAILGPGEIVGEMSVIDRELRSGSVVTLEDSVVFWIDRDAFQNCLQTMPKLTLNLTEILTKRLRIANERIKVLATLDVYGRVAQGDLASLVGASRVRVNQALVLLKKRGGISTDQLHHITVRNEDVLARAY